MDLQNISDLYFPPLLFYININAVGIVNYNIYYLNHSCLTLGDNDFWYYSVSIKTFISHKQGLIIRVAYKNMLYFFNSTQNCSIICVSRYARYPGPPYALGQ